MKISHFFIDRPVFATVISIVTIVAGVLSIFSLPISQYPEIAPPTINIRASYPGANAKTVSDVVAAPIEQQINGVENMLYMSSQATNDGSLSLTVTFKTGTDLDTAQVQVQNRIAVAEPQLPQEVVQRGITVKKASPDITLAIGIYSEDGSRDTVYLSNYATLQIRDQLLRVPGVGDITIFGARDYSMRIWLDPEKVASRNLTVGEVVSAIREQNIQVASGIIGAPPIPKGSTEFQYTMNAQGRLTQPEEFGEIIIKVGAQGAITRLSDVARIELGAADYSTANSFNGKPAVGIGVFQLPGTNSIETADTVYKLMKTLSGRFPPGVNYAISYDTTLFVRDSIKDVVKTLLEGVFLVVIVVLVFLQNWRAAIVPLLAIPVSLIGTFSALWLADFSMNNLSLFGLVLAIGIVVDDAIVVVENVERWIEKGLKPREAAFKAMDEVTPAVIAIAFGLTAVFVPVAFMSGISGQFYRQFALTISFSTLISAFNSLTLSPALAAILLKPKGESTDRLTKGIDYVLGRFFKFFNRSFDYTGNVYVRALTKVMRATGVSLVVYVLLVLLAYFGFKSVPTGFIPAQDQGYVYVNLQMPDAASITRTQDMMKKLTEAALKVEGVNGVFGVSGVSLITRSNSSAAGLMFVPLKPFKERIGNENQTINSIMKNLSAEFSKIKDGQATVIPPPPVRGIGTAGGFKMIIQDRSGLATPQDLQKEVEKVIVEANKRLEIGSAFTSYRSSFPQLYADVDREKVKQQHVPLSNVFDTLQVYLGGLYINDYNFLGRTWRVTAQADAPYRATSEDITKLKTKNANGEMVPLGSVLTVKDVTGPDRVQRYNLYQSAEINGTTKQGFSSGQSIDAMEEVAKNTLGPQYSFEWTDLAFQEKAAATTALLIFPLCILFVWLTHAAEYESFALSSSIILIVPMCLLCGIAGIWFKGLDNNIFTQIGFIVLAGMSVKNAVLIVEFAKQQQEHHPEMTAEEAAISAAHIRLRPILMTSFAFIFGVLPLIVAKGAGAEMRQSLGTTVFYGMLGVTFFGLFFTPVFYKIIMKLKGHS